MLVSKRRCNRAPGTGVTNTSCAVWLQTLGLSAKVALAFTVRETMNLRLILAITLLAPSLALACGPKEAEIFSCNVGKKKVQVCQAPSQVIYKFGTKEKSELTMSSPNATARDKGMSTASGNEQNFYFENDGTNYLVFHMSSPTDGTLYDAGIVVRPKDKSQEITRLECKEGSVRFNPKAIRAKANEIGDIKRPGRNHE